jgi:hypothetical protein
VDVDSTGMTDGDHLADPRVPGDRRGQLANGCVVFGLADQPGQLAGETGVRGGECGQDLGQRPDRRGVLWPGGGLIQDRADLMVGSGALDQVGEPSPAWPGAGLGPAALPIDIVGG